MTVLIPCPVCSTKIPIELSSRRTGIGIEITVSSRAVETAELEHLLTTS